MRKRIEKCIEETVEPIKEVHEKPVALPPYTLVVKSPFGKYKKGDQIHDAQTVNDILAGNHEHMVLKVSRKGS